MVDDITISLKIEKQAPEQRRWWSKGYIHTTGDGEQVEDYSGDVVDTPEAQAALEESFYKFVTDYRTGDLEHQHYGAATMIEGFIVTKEKKAAGLFPADMDEGIHLGFQANATDEGDMLWEGIKSGRLKEMSIVGTGRREPI